MIREAVHNKVLGLVCWICTISEMTISEMREGDRFMDMGIAAFLQSLKGCRIEILRSLIRKRKLLLFVSE